MRVGGKRRGGVGATRLRAAAAPYDWRLRELCAVVLRHLDSHRRRLALWVRAQPWWPDRDDAGLAAGHGDDAAGGGQPGRVGLGLSHRGRALSLVVDVGRA